MLRDVIYRHRVTVHPCLGRGAAGPVYGPPITLACWIEQDRARTPKGEAEHTAGPVCIPIADLPLVPLDSRVVVAGADAWVTGHVIHDSAGLLPTVMDHVAVSLTTTRART